MTEWRVTRRRLFGTGAMAALAWGLRPRRLAGAEPDGAWTFAVVNDLHYFDAGCAPFFERVVDLLNGADPRPEFVLLAGDLTEHGTAAEFAGLRDVLCKARMPLYAVPGNHDFDQPDARKPYDEAFPGQANYTFQRGPWQFMGLDTCPGQKWANLPCPEATVRFVEETASRLDAKRPTVVFTHFPLGADVKWRIPNADAVLEPLKKVNLVAAFCGHFHGLTERRWREAAITTNRCCSFRRGNHDKSREKGFFLCRALPGRIERRFVEVPQSLSGLMTSPERTLG